MLQHIFFRIDSIFLEALAMLHWPHFEDQCSASLLQVSWAIIITFGAITVGIKRRVGKPGWLLCWFPSAGWWWSGRRVCQSESLDHTGVSWFHKQSFQPDSHTCLSPSANNKTIVGFHNIKSQFGLNCEGQSLDCHCNKNPSFKAVINKLFFFLAPLYYDQGQKPSPDTTSKHVWSHSSSVVIDHVLMPSPHWIVGFTEIFTITAPVTCSPMTHWPAFIFSSSKCRACLSAYFTPISIFVSIPLVFA